MKFALFSAAACGAALLGLAGPAAGPALAADAAPAAAKPVNPNIDQQALDALARMGDYLRTLNSFEMTAETSLDTDVDGQLITFDGGAVYKARRPNGLFIETSTDRKVRQVFYDGKKVTIYSPRMKLYASFAAPPTIKEALKQANEKYDVVLPLTDLFIWGTPDARTDDIVTADYIGPAKCGDAICDQFAIQEADIDWQIWIQQGDKPLPRKVIITTILGDSQPRFSARMNWTVNPALTDAAFTFVPPPESHAIQIAAASQ